MIYIYKIFNNFNNKVYIGQSSNPKSRFITHKSRGNLLKDTYKNSVFYQEIHENGKENFFMEILDKTESQETADLLEKKYIKDLNTLEPNGYNCSDGGSNNFNFNSNFSKKVSESRKKSDKIKRIEILEYDYELNFVKKWNSKQELMKEKGVTFTSKSTYIYSNKHFYLRDKKYLKEIRDKQIVYLDENGKEITFRYHAMEFERDGIYANTFVLELLKGKVLISSDKTFFLFRKDITKEEIERRINHFNPKRRKKIICTYPDGQKKVFEGTIDSAKELNMNRQLIAKACKKGVVYKGYFFEYFD